MHARKARYAERHADTPCSLCITRKCVSLSCRHGDIVLPDCGAVVQRCLSASAGHRDMPSALEVAAWRHCDGHGFPHAGAAACTSPSSQSPLSVCGGGQGRRGVRSTNQVRPANHNASHCRSDFAGDQGECGRELVNGILRVFRRGRPVCGSGAVFHLHARQLHIACVIDLPEEQLFIRPCA